MSLAPPPSEFEREMFVSVTPAGCYYTIEGHDPTVARQVLTRLLCAATTPPLSLYEGTGREEVMELVKSGLVELANEPSTLPKGNFSTLLPNLLPALSERGRVVLTESGQGLYIDYAGFEQHEAEELAVLAADLRAMAEKRQQLLENQLNVRSQAFGIVDPAGNSEIGFWPLYIANDVFTLIVLGIPKFNSKEFCTLIWALTERYGVVED